MHNCYVYQHLDSQGAVCYVGFGTGHRYLDSRKRSPEHEAFIEKRLSEVGLNFIEIVFNNGTEKECREVEAKLIKELKPKFNKQMNEAADAGRGVNNCMSALTQEEVDAHRSRFST